jgi:molybdenum cofactor cytidylyltransferase
LKKVGIIILAAGESKRMGSPKQLLQIEGKSLITRTAEVALATDCYPVVLVIGAHKPQIAPEIVRLPLTVIDNPTWHEGMASSVKMGLIGMYMTYKDIDAVLFLVCDQPHLSVALLEKILAEYQSKNAPIVACQYAGQVGVPVLFTRPYFEELLDLKGDKGAKSILMSHLDEAHLVHFEGGEIDLDTPDDYQKVSKK